MASGAIAMSKAEQAIVEYLRVVGVGTGNIFAGKSASDKEAPMIACIAEGASEANPGEGNFIVQMAVTIKTMAAVDVLDTAATVKAGSETITTAVFNAIGVDDLADQLSDSLADFYCFGVAGEAEFEAALDEDCWVETVRIPLYCAASDM